MANQSLMKDKLLLIIKTRTRLVSNYQSGHFVNASNHMVNEIHSS